MRNLTSCANSKLINSLHSAGRFIVDPNGSFAEGFDSADSLFDRTLLPVAHLLGDGILRSRPCVMLRHRLANIACGGCRSTPGRYLRQNHAVFGRCPACRAYPFVGIASWFGASSRRRGAPPLPVTIRGSQSRTGDGPIPRAASLKNSSHRQRRSGHCWRNPTARRNRGRKTLLPF